MGLIKKISEIFTFAVPFLILCSCINLIAYYRHWNIPILDYLSAPELLFLFIQPLLIILGLAAIGASLYVTGVGILLLLGNLGAGRKEKKEEEKENEKTGEVPKPKTALKYRIFGWVAMVVFIGAGGWIYFKGIWFDYEIFPVVFVHLILGLVLFLVIKKLLGSQRNTSTAEAIIGGITIMLISASFFYGRYQAHYTVTNPIPHKIVLKDGSVIETDSNLIYLGKTSNYYFFYNNAENQASIIPVEETKATYVKKGN